MGESSGTGVVREAGRAHALSKAAQVANTQNERRCVEIGASMGEEEVGANEVNY